MANELYITIIGRLTQDVELRFTPSGTAVANLTIAQNARVFDKNSNEWKDKPANFFRCNIWREAAENAAESLQKGMGVIAYGEVTSRSYETKDGTQRTVQEIERPAQEAGEPQAHLDTIRAMATPVPAEDAEAA